MQRKSSTSTLFNSKKRANSFSLAAVELELSYVHTKTDEDLTPRTSAYTFKINSKSGLEADIHSIDFIKTRDAGIKSRVQNTEMKLSGKIGDKKIEFSTTSISELRDFVAKQEFKQGVYMDWALKLRKI